MGLEIQKYLLNGGTLESLKEDYGIIAKRHAGYSNLVLLKYSQIDSPKAHPIVRECRGLILDEANDWAVVSRPLDRFFNYGEFYADTLDQDSIRAYEKLDGSLMCLYYYDGRWNVQTSGTPDASGEVNQMGLTFKELFWQTWNQQGYKLPTPFWRGATFVFELVGPLNQVVVQYQEADIHLLAVRLNSSGKEVSSEARAKSYGWKHAERFDPANLDVSLPATALEGYILIDKDNKRVKIKTAQYVALHRTGSHGMTAEDALAIVMAGEIDEMEAYFPKHKDILRSLESKWLALRSQLKADWSKYGPLAGDRAEFAKAVSQLKHKSVLFSIADSKDWLAMCVANPKRTLKLLAD